MSFKKDNMVEYEFFDVTADVGFLAYGITLEEAYENASKAMFNVISNTNNVDHVISKNISIVSEDLISLLYDYLDELLFISETEFLLFSEFKVSIINKNNEFKLDGVVKGEPIDWNKHERGSEVKAVTYHLMNVETDDMYKVRVILDL